MRLKVFKTFWGWNSNYPAIVDDLLAHGFDGLEAPAPRDAVEFSDLAERLNTLGLDYISEICTTGSYVAERRATPQQHLDDLESKIIYAKPLCPLFFNVMAGCDAWPLETQIDFFSGAIGIAERHGVVCSFETHRGRSFFNPWITRDVVRALPKLRLTLDVSHWMVVCERAIDTEWDVIEELAPHVHHIHGRFGYDQGPQLPHPADPAYAEFVAVHRRCWEAAWSAQQRRGVEMTTLTPECGPDGYTHRLPFTGAPIDDFAALNRWIAAEEREHFRKFIPG